MRPATTKKDKWLKLHRSMQGQVILEFAIILPIFVMLFILTFEIGRALQVYLALSRLAYEGARYASTQPGLEEGCFDSGAAAGTGNTYVTYTTIGGLIAAHSAGQHYPFQLSVALSCSCDDPTHTITHDKNVRVTVHSMYQPIFNIMPQIPIRVEAVGAYLY